MKNKKILKLTVLALLAAVGVVLMSYIQFPYPIAPFLKIEFSDFVVIFAYLLFGFKEAFIVAILKTGCDLIIRGPETGGAFPFVAHITALIASLSYVVAIWFVNKLIKREKFKEQLEYNIVKYSIVVLIVSSIMTFANYTILTPLFLGEVSFFGIGLSEVICRFSSQRSETMPFFSIARAAIPSWMVGCSSSPRSPWLR